MWSFLLYVCLAPAVLTMLLILGDTAVRLVHAMRRNTLARKKA